MKPTKNRVFCQDCRKVKMVFETEKKAQTFMKFNAEAIEAASGFSPQRAYYCLFCDGWHVTSIANEIGQSKNEQLYEIYKQEKLEKAKQLAHHQEIQQAVQQKLAGMTEAEKRTFLNERIAALKDEIDLSTPYKLVYIILLT